jgi:hypothetical protein
MSDGILGRGVFALVIGLGVMAGLARADEPAPVKEKSYPVRGFFQRFRCAVKEDTISCNSWRSECRFVFGSCKDFFGDPCPDRMMSYGDGKKGCASCK